MNWIKQNWFEVVFGGVFLIAMIVALRYDHESSRIRFELMAHAQEKPKITYNLSDDGVYKMNSTVEGLSVHGHLVATLDAKGNLDVVEPEFWKMVEKHCVTVVQEKHDEKVPVAGMNDEVPEIRQGNYTVHHPEVTARLRCH